MNSIGVDIGGTFTDLVGYRDGTLVISKTLTTPANPTLGVAKALELAHTRMQDLDEFLHGTTIAINTVLERKGDKTALLTTEGFRDVYEIARGNRPDAFDIGFQRAVAGLLNDAGGVVGRVLDFGAALHGLRHLVAHQLPEQRKTRPLPIPMSGGDLIAGQPHQTVAAFQGVIEEGEFVIPRQRRQP